MPRSRASRPSSSSRKRLRKQGEAEQGQAEAGHAEQEEVERLDGPQSLEGHAQGDGQLVPVVELLAQDGLHLAAAPTGLGQAGQREGEGHGEGGDDEEGPAPGLGSTDQGGDPAGQEGSEDEPAQLEGEGQAEDPAAGFDGIRVDQHGAVHRQLVGLGEAGPDSGEEQGEGVLDQAGHRDQHGPDRDAGRGDPRPWQAVGQAADGHGAEEEEDAAGAGDGAHDGVAGPQGVLDVRAEHGERGVVEAGDGPRQPDGDDRRPAPDVQGLAQRHGLALADPGQEVVGEHDGGRRGAGGLPLGLSLEDGCGQAGPALVPAFVLTRHGRCSGQAGASIGSSPSTGRYSPASVVNWARNT